MRPPSSAPPTFRRQDGGRADYKFDTGKPRTDTGYQQIQTQMPEVTQGAREHDVVWVADTDQAFGEYVPYRNYDPKPVVGTQA